MRRGIPACSPRHSHRLGGRYRVQTWRRADFIKYAQSIGDSSYNILREVLAAQQIKQLNRNSDEYLLAVNALDRHIRQTIAQLNTYKAQNPDGARCSASPAD
jgi:hypothetical protein